MCLYYSDEFIVYWCIFIKYLNLGYTDIWHVINIESLKLKEPKLQKLIHPLSKIFKPMIK